MNKKLPIFYNCQYDKMGKIVDILMTAKCMNPIIFIDELDKISNTEQGREIISILTQITDSTQNDEFEDKFFSGVKLDLSKILFVFSFNDISLIDNVLKDRITIIDVPILKLSEKLVIIKDYMLPDICKDVGININEIIIEDNLIKYLIDTYTLEPGVRKIKEKITDIIREINLKASFDEITFPFTITKDFCEKLFELKNKIKPRKIINEPSIGIVNGLYASKACFGGITYIQAIKFPSSKILDLNITGSVGESMKESVEYSLKIAYNLLEKTAQENIVKNTFGIHIHCPEAAVKKDGSSAGVAITVAIYSLLANKKINNTIALTGEIDVMGNISAIGGLYLKLTGAKKAGIKLALYPEENEEDIDIMRKEGNSPEDDDFVIKSVQNINQVIEIING
jgi:ATP-dependent Lon protease